MTSKNFKCPHCTWGILSQEQIESHDLILYSDKIDPDLQHVVFQHEGEEANCPFCGTECSRTFLGTKVNFYVRGDGIAKDPKGAKVDMDLFKLQHDDPYADSRVEGEKDHIEKTLKNKKKFDPKKKSYNT